MGRSRWFQLSGTLIVAAACGSSESALPSGPDPSFARKPPAPASGIVATTLPGLGGGSAALAINDDGIVVGNAEGSGTYFPVRWTQTSAGWQLVKLQDATGSAADINEAGAAVGVVNGIATFWPVGGGAETIGPGSPRAINAAGVVVGSRDGAANGGAVAWTRSGGTWTEHALPRQAGTTGFNEVDDIGDDGVVVGYAQGANGVQHAVKWVPGAVPGEWAPAVPLDAQAGATNSAATGIDGSDIVGLIWRCTDPATFSTCTSREAYHWSLAGSSTGSLGGGDAWPEGLATGRYIVGVSFTSTRRQSTARAFVWSPANPTFQDLGVPKGQSQGWAVDINNPTASRAARQAVGHTWGSSGQSTAVLWTIP
jgi:probable HAF family extracellular repeat protein